jgi:hypothetical protein
MWGQHAHISKVVGRDSTPSEIKRLIQVSQQHTNYQILMLVEDIHGITDLDATAPVIENGVQVKILSLRTTLLRYLCLSNGHQLIAEIHQAAG